MDPNVFESALLRGLRDAIVEPMPTKPRSQRFQCSDCGKLRRGSERYSCRTCGEFVCAWCVDKHPRQHPPEAQR